MIGLPCAACAAALKILIDLDYVEAFQSRESVLRETQAWSGFSFLVGFLIVFRTSQAYNRFWDGCTSTHKMRAEWFDGCSSIMAFCKHSTVDIDTVAEFKGTLIR